MGIQVFSGLVILETYRVLSNHFEDGVEGFGLEVKGQKRVSAVNLFTWGAYRHSEESSCRWTNTSNTSGNHSSVTTITSSTDTKRGLREVGSSLSSIVDQGFSFLQ